MSNVTCPPPDLRQTPAYAHYMQTTGWQVEKIHHSRHSERSDDFAKNPPRDQNVDLEITSKHKQPDIFIFIKTLPLIGSIVKIQRPHNIPLYQIETKVAKHHPLMIKIEPHHPYHPNLPNLPNLKTHYLPLTTHGYSSDSWPLLPSRTVTINLQPSLKNIRAQFKKDARYCLRKAEKNNLIIETGDYQTFFTNWKRQAAKKHLWTPNQQKFNHLIDAFGNQAIVLNCFTKHLSSRVAPCKTAGCDPARNPILRPTCQLSNVNCQMSQKWLAGVFLLTTKTTAHYYYASSNQLGKKLHAPYLLVWEALKHAKQSKLETFDFEGIVDPRYKSTKKWQGFSHFKQAFGGKIVEYPGSYTKYFGIIGKFLKLTQSLFG